MNWKTAENQKLVEAIRGLKTVDETEWFLRDLMTEGEIATLCKRKEMEPNRILRIMKSGECHGKTWDVKELADGRLKIAV